MDFPCKILTFYYFITYASILKQYSVLLCMFSFLYKYDYSLYVILALYFIFYANTVCVIICVAICKFILLLFTSLLFSIITICYNLFSIVIYATIY